MKKRKIVLLINTLLSGGSEKQSLYAAKLLKSTHDIMVVVYSFKISDRNAKYLQQHEINHVILEGSFINKFQKLSFILKKHKTEILITYLFGMNMLAPILAKFNAVPFVIGGFRSSLGLGKMKDKLFQFTHNHFNYLTICNSYAGLKFLEAQGFKSSKLRVIHNGIEKLKPKEQNISKEPIYILSVARFVDQKDYPTALKAIAHLKTICDDEINFKYLIVGHGTAESEEKMAQLIQEYNIGHLVEMIIDPEDVGYHYSKSDIFLSTSLFEGFSNSIMEAMMHSLPAVVTNVDDNGYLITENISGFLCAKRDFQNISLALKNLLESAELRIRMGQAAYNHICDNYQLSELANKYLDLIDSIPEHKSKINEHL